MVGSCSARSLLETNNTKFSVLMEIHPAAEKVAQSEWLKSQNKSRKKTKWIVGILILVVLLCVAGGTSAGIILTRKGSKGSSGGSSTGSANGGGGSGLSGPDDIRQNGDLNADSAEIKALMSNTKLKKVFHGMDYTPLNAVFPECAYPFLHLPSLGIPN